ncbi:DUF3500 domain-containing protein [Lutimonas zeaxanthinifaciens]|uniref:DUF3500 domain-containing protein n=1 Tax=Lutimonas zeaxanthinifaciens TaxID=3060215 RepID=UPI00265CE192|nr:DUF3500 domain-containing protein [Lutimonas sp. YSD2104]WKK67532.1 DUF3500 domain-containing protein [Lutimonas sp. YSD2104]
MKNNKRTLSLILLISLLVAAFRYTKDSPVSDFLKSLDQEQLEKAQLPFDDLSREVWHFLPGKMWPRKGILLKDLNPKQKELAFRLLHDHLSEAGYQKIMNIIDLENVLIEMGQDKDFRDPDRYFVAIYGDPLQDDLWAWSFEGHHLSLNFTITNKKVSMTPRFLGANPATIPIGKKKGQRALKAEEDLAFELINSFDTNQRIKAIFSTRPYFEIVTSNAMEIGPLRPVGIAFAELNEQQQKHLLALINEYLSAMPVDIAKRRMKEIEKENLYDIRFGWAGATEPGQGHYYRIQGQSFLIEFDNTINNANHIHTVWRDFDGDFGKDIIREHYLESSH